MKQPLPIFPYFFSRCSASPVYCNKKAPGEKSTVANIPIPLKNNVDTLTTGGAVSTLGHSSWHVLTFTFFNISAIYYT